MEAMPHVPASIVTCLHYCNGLFDFLLPLLYPLVSSPCSIQSNSDPHYVPPLLRNFHAPPPCSKSQRVLENPTWTLPPLTCVLSHSTPLLCLQPHQPAHHSSNTPEDTCLGAFALLCSGPGSLSSDVHMTHVFLSCRSLLFTLPKMPTAFHPSSALSASFFFSFQSHFLSNTLNIVHIYLNYYLFHPIKM